MIFNPQILSKAAKMGTRADSCPKIKLNEASATFLFLGPVARQGLFAKNETLSISAWCASWHDVKRRLAVAGYRGYLIKCACRSMGVSYVRVG